MTFDQFNLWQFFPPLERESEIECPSCKEWIKPDAWIESEVYCEDCGEHMAMKCPICEERHDHIFGPVFKTRVMV